MRIIPFQQDTTFKPMDPAYKQETFGIDADTNSPKETKAAKAVTKTDTVRNKAEKKKSLTKIDKEKLKKTEPKIEKVPVKPQEPVAVKEIIIPANKGIAQPTEKFITKADTNYSLFKDHKLQVQHGVPILRKPLNDDWFIYSILGVLVLFGIINRIYGKRFSQLTDAFFTSRIAGKLAREENVLQQRVTILLFITFILITAAFAYLASSYYNFYPFKVTGLQYYYVLIGLILASYVIKLIIVKFIGFVFKTEKEVSEYVFNIVLFNNALGITLFPFVLCLAFSPLNNPSILIKVAIFCMSILFLFRIARGMIIGVSNGGISKFYLFIYLCTLEILPLVVIFKVLVSRI